MGFLSRFENKMEDAVEGAAGSLSRSPISPVQISKKCERQMMRNKMVGVGKEYAPTLYTVLVNGNDDQNLFSFYPTLSGEIETCLKAAATREGLYMDGQPLVRFIVDSNLKHGRFDVIAEVVASAIIKQLRLEEMERYGIASPVQGANRRPASPYDEPSYDEISFDSSNDEDAFDPFAPQTAAPSSNSAASGLDVPPSPSETIAFDGESRLTTARLDDITNNRTHFLQASPLVAGRANENDIIIPDINASRRHAEFSRRGNAWYVRDLGSKNGTQVNGETIHQPVALIEGDRLTMGLTDYVFSTK